MLMLRFLAAILGNISAGSSPARLSYTTFINDNEFYQRVTPIRRFNQVRVVRDALHSLIDTAYCTYSHYKAAADL